MLKWLVVFFGVVALDFIWGRYIQATAGNNALVAGLWAVPVFLVGGAVTLGYVNDTTLLVPAAVGAFVGTYLSVKCKQFS